MYQGSIQKLELDLISTCNARCPLCFRQDANGETQPHFPINQHIDLGLLEKALRDARLQTLREIIFCGNYGDPLASPRLREVLELIDSTHPGVPYLFHTNGGIGSEETWRHLGRGANGKGRFVIFSIDGLSDTNALYRRGVHWEKIMRNVNTFLEAGGRAAWKYVVFPHNAHQVEEARALATRLGFAKFRAVPTYCPLPEAKQPISQDAADLAPADLRGGEVRCRANQDSMIYIDFTGRVWPCCWVAGWKFAADGRRAWHHQNFEPKDGFNSLTNFSLDQILASDWYQSQLPSSWRGGGALKLHSECVAKCGTKKA